MINNDALSNATIREVKDARRFLTRIINDCERSAVVDLMPNIEIEYSRNGRQITIVYGKLLGLARGSLQIRSEDTGHIHWVKLRQITRIEGRGVGDVQDMTVSEIRRQTGV